MTSSTASSVQSPCSVASALMVCTCSVVASFSASTADRTEREPAPSPAYTYAVAGRASVFGGVHADIADAQCDTPGRGITWCRIMMQTRLDSSVLGMQQVLMVTHKFDHH